MTYPDPTLAEYLSATFIPVRINTDEHPKLTHQYQIPWTPALVALHPRNIRLREVIGYLPPGELLAELTLMKALHDLRDGRPGDAEALLQTLHANPEALYWQGIAAFWRSGRQKEPLFAIWRQLAAAYPASTWAHRTTLTDWPDSPYL